MTAPFPLRPALLTLLLVFAPRTTGAQSFSTDPLREPVAWPENDLPRTAESLLSWLTARRDRVGGEQYEMLRGQIYAVLADKLRRQFAAGGGSGIPSGDPTLGRLLLEADRLGVTSAAPVADRLGAHQSRPWSAVQADEYNLEFDGETFGLSANAGRWSIRFPWYWLLLGAGRSTKSAASDSDFDMAGLRLLMTANEPPLSGAAQPGVMLFSVDGVEFHRHLAQFGVSVRDSTAPVIPTAARSYQHRDPARHQQSEVSLFKTSSGWLLAGYFGPDGPYRANRSQYLDLLRTVRVR